MRGEDLILEWIEEIGRSDCVHNSRKAGPKSNKTQWVLSLKRGKTTSGSHRILYISGDLVRIRLLGDVVGCTLWELRMTDPNFFNDLYSWIWGNKAFWGIRKEKKENARYPRTIW